jgi:hypothetical protein
MRTLQEKTWNRLLASIEGEGGGGGGGGEGGGGDGGGAPAPFYEAFTREALKTSPTIQAFKTVEELAFGYESLVKRMGIEPERRLDLPKDPADKDGWKGVWKRLGAPEKPEDYGFKLGDGASEADTALVTDFARTAAEMNMPKDMAAGALKWWETKVAEATAAQAAQFETQRAAGETTLKEAWGQAYDQRTKEVGRLLAEHVAAAKTPGEKAAAEALQRDLGGNLGNYPGVTLFIGRMLDKMAEPGAAGGEGGDGGGDRAYTPAQARAEARKLEAHPGFHDRSHPEHKAVVDKRFEYLKMAG